MLPGVCVEFIDAYKNAKSKKEMIKSLKYDICDVMKHNSISKKKKSS